VRYCFNNATWQFGRTVRNKLDEFDVNKATGERRRKWTLEQILEGFAFGRLQQMSAAFLLSGRYSMDI